MNSVIHGFKPSPACRNLNICNLASVSTLPVWIADYLSYTICDFEVSGQALEAGGKADTATALPLQLPSDARRNCGYGVFVVIHCLWQMQNTSGLQSIQPRMRPEGMKQITRQANDSALLTGICRLRAAAFGDLSGVPLLLLPSGPPTRFCNSGDYFQVVLNYLERLLRLQNLCMTVVSQNDI
ncbi:MAG: hypothetical protein JOZ29_03395 [Deltaproteobacteria bacterium]|nr:hypothetical protein [Deltaproteobacteria bacterium]